MLDRFKRKMRVPSQTERSLSPDFPSHTDGDTTPPAEFDTLGRLPNPITLAREAADREGSRASEILAAQTSGSLELQYPTKNCLDDSFVELDLAALPAATLDHLNECVICASLVEAATDAATGIDGLMADLQRRLAGARHAPATAQIGRSPRAHRPSEIVAKAKDRRKRPERTRLILPDGHADNENDY